MFIVIPAIAVGLIFLALKPGPGTCTCSHSGTAHRHYRSGTDCALCSCERLRIAR